MEETFLVFSRFGRHNNIELKAESESDDHIIEVIEKNYHKYLFSSCIEISYDRQENKGLIFGGFQLIGEFHIEKRKEMPILPKPPRNTIKPTKKYSDNGWISPEGEFFACEYQGHETLSQELFNAHIMKNNIRLGLNCNFDGWIHLSNGNFLIIPFDSPLTQKQIDFFMDFCQYCHIDLQNFTINSGRMKFVNLLNQIK
jgi:hypothetical protein